MARDFHGRLTRAGSIGAAVASLLISGCGVFLTPQHRLERAQREMSTGRWQDAAVDLRNVLQKEPNNAQAWLLLAQLSLDAADLSGAQSGLTHALAAGAKGQKVDELRARVWLAAGQPRQLLDAIAQHQIALAEPEQTLLSVRALLAQDLTDAALAKLQPLVAAQPGLTEARDLVAEILAAEGKFTPALQQLEVAIEHDAKSYEPPLLKGFILQQLGQYASAQQALEQGLKLMPPSEPILHRVKGLIALADVRLALGDVDAAAGSAAAAAKLEPQSPAVGLLDARLKIARKDLEGAVAELERVVNAAPGYTQARLLLGATLLQRGELQQAQEQLQQVVQSTPGNLAARKLLADVRLKLGQPEGALGVLSPALSTDSLDPQLLSLYGAAAKSLGNKQALIEALQHSESEHPGDQTVLLNLAEAYLAAGEPEQALPVIEKTTQNGDLRRDRLLIATLLSVRGPEAAGTELQHLLAAHPRDPGLLDLAAGYYITQNRLNDAREALRISLSIQPGNVSSLVDLARLDAAAGDPAAAESRLQAALKAHPEALPIRLALADVMVRRKAYDAARTLLQGAGQKAGPQVNFALAQVALASGDPKTANQDLDQAIATNPGSAALVESAGLLLMKANQFDAALGRFAKATQIAPDDARYWLDTARAQLALGQPVAARSSLEKADQLQPQWLPVVSTLALIDLQQGNGQAALSRVQGLLAKRPNDSGVLQLEGDVQSALKQPSAALTAYGKAQQLRPSAQLAASLYRERLAAHMPAPQQPLEQWLARAPSDRFIRDMLGEYYLTVRNSPSLAAREFKTVIRQDPNDVVALNDLAWALNQSGDPGALALAERAYHLAPNLSGVNDTLGWVMARNGKAAGAVDYLKRAVKLDPSDPNVQYHLAYVLAQTGNPTEARQILGRILASRQPFDSRAEAQQLLSRVKS